MPYKFAQIILSSKTKIRTASDIFLAEVDPEKELRLGKLFILAEIEARGLYRPDDGLKIINFLLSEIPKNYYQNEKYFFRESGLIKIDQALESSLNAANKSFAAFLKEQRLPPAGKSLNLTAGVIHKDSLYFSVAGNNRAFLIARSKGKDGVKCRIINILGEDEEPSGPGKYLFSNIISGPLPRGACALFTNEALPEYFTEKKLANIVSSLAPAGAAELIKNELAGIGRLTSILGLIIKNIKQEKIVSESFLISPPNEQSASLSYLDKTEKQTETFLSPSGLLPVRKLFARLGETVRLKSKKYLPGSKFVLIGQKIILKKRTSRFSLANALSGIGLFAIRAIRLVAHLVGSFSLKGLIGFFNSLPIKIIGLFSRVKNWFLGMKLLNKILLGALVLSVLLFSLNLARSARSKKQSEFDQSYNETYQLITQKQNQIEASLLYGNEKGARELVLEAKELLEALPQINEDQMAGYAELKEIHDAQVIKVSHIINIPDPEELANFSLARPNVRPETLIKTGNKIFSAARNAGIMFKIDLTGKAVNTIALPDNTPSLSAPVADKAGNLLYRNSEYIYSFSPETEKWISRKINYSGDLGEFSVYNNRLYFLSPAEGQIIRLARAGEGYGSGYGWLRDKTDMQNTVDIDIDGDIYTLDKDGTIKKYSSGRPADLPMEALSTSITGATTLKISAEPEGYIYILEPGQKRLVVYGKDGSYKMQYQSDKFNGLTDFHADEKEKVIYFLNNASVYKVKAEHIK